MHLFRQIAKLAILPVILVFFGFTQPAYALVLESDLNQNGISDSTESDVVMSSSATLPAGEYNFNNLTVTNYAILTLEGDVNSSEDFKGVKINANNLTVELGSTISADGKGYLAGPGAPDTNYEAGASYGGMGGGINPSSVYGSSLEPIELGSGAQGHRGGGAIRLVVTNSLQNDGSISVNGYWQSSSGGSIYITTNQISGSGSFTANGAQAAWPYGSIGGGGGRVAIYYQDFTFSGTATALAGTFCFYGCNPAAENGTVGLINTSDNSLNVISSWRFEQNNSPFNFSNIFVKNNAKVVVDGGVVINADNLSLDGYSFLDSSNNSSLNIENIAINGFSTWTLSGNENFNVNNLLVTDNSKVTVIPEQILNLEVSNITIDSSSAISADDKGYIIGPGTVDVLYSAGASYGGRGGGVDSKPVYGSSTAPTDFGSGTESHRGGGAIRLIVSNNLQNDGTISAGTVLPRSSGGSVYSTVNHLSGNGIFQADGGDSGWPYGPIGGGGGRVAIYYQDSTFTGTATALAGTYCFYGCAPAADDGTVLMNLAEPVCTVNCYSNVLFLPGIKASILKRGNDTLWPPTPFNFNDVSQLALNENGESVNDVHVDGILNNFLGTDIYEPFSNFMDGISGENELINEWLPLAYDWRFLPNTIIENGIKNADGTITNVIEQIESLAKRSKNGKVIIVAHSMGGLFGKAIIKQLQTEGKDNLIDSFVMVGTPQLGTPQAVASVLHGDEEGMLVGFIAHPADLRSVAQNMPSAYSLLPSRRYFDVVLDPVIKFDAEASFAQDWRVFWGETIDTFNDFASFVTGGGVPRQRPAEDILRIPEVVKGDLLLDAIEFHDEYDSYIFPGHIRVVQVAGWGRPTTKAINYTTSHGLPSYETVPTVEGDATVIYPSAVSSNSNETYFFNLATYNALENVPDYRHRDLLGALPVQDIIRNIIQEDPVIQNSFIGVMSPNPGTLEDQIVVSSHSPVIIGVYDENGNFTGIDPNQNLSVDILTISENIPGSTFIYSAESQSIFLPHGGVYDFIYRGIGDGPTTVKIDNFVDNLIVPVSSYTDMHTTANTVATFSVESLEPENTTIKIDSNGDGQIDKTIISDQTKLSLNELILFIKKKISILVIKDKLKQNLLRKVVNLEKKIESKNHNNLKIISNVKKIILAQEIKEKISMTEANEIIDLLGSLEVKFENFVFDPLLFLELRNKVELLNIKFYLKNELLRFIDKLEKKDILVKTLDNLSKNIINKSTNGQILDEDAQMLIDILVQIEAVL